MKTKLFLLGIICLVTITTFAQTDTNELNFNFVKKGNGSPVVIFESGLGETLGGWKTIQDSISKITTTISYDRIGLGKSSATENPRTLENLTSELNGFLENEKIDSPLIFVGHSLGGFIIRKFQNSYPEKVVGLLFVDPSHERLMERILATKTEEESNMMTKGMDGFYASQPIGIQNEYKEVSSMDNEMKELKLPTEIPITILASYQAPPPPFSPDDIKIKKELFNNWVESAPQTKLISTTKSGHYIHYSEPNLVIDEIKNLLNEIED